MDNRELKDFWLRGCEFLNSEYAILAGAMSWVSENNLVSAVSNAGGFGVLACGAMSVDLLREEIKCTQEKTDKSFGVNLITMHPDLDALIDVCGDLGVSHVVLAGGVPKGDSIKRIKKYGAKVTCFAPALSLAKRLIRNGADALIIEGSEAGGHVGPISTSILAQEILGSIKEVPIFVAGGIGKGSLISSYLQMGASGVQIGTLFAASQESIAHDNFKKVFCKASARDAVTTIQLDPQFSVIPVRAIQNKATIEFLEVQKKAIESYKKGEYSQEKAQLEIEHFWAGSLRRAVIDGDVEYGSIMAGQSVGMVKKVETVADIIGRLVKETEIALNGLE